MIDGNLDAISGCTPGALIFLNKNGYITGIDRTGAKIIFKNTKYEDVVCKLNLKAERKEDAINGEQVRLEDYVRFPNEIRDCIESITKNDGKSKHFEQVFWNDSIYQFFIAHTEKGISIYFQEFFETQLLDAVSGVYNKNAFKLWKKEFDRLLEINNQDSEWYLGMLYMDANEFSNVNNTYGHAKGDEIIHDIGTLLRGSTRATDYIFNPGGDEFVVLLPDTDNEGCKEIFERVLYNQDRYNEENKIKLSLAVGYLATNISSRLGGGLDNLLKKCDELMYRHKALCKRAKNYPLATGQIRA